MRAVMLCLVLATLCVAAVAEDATQTVSPGSLQILDANGQVTGFCPLKHTSVQATISGFIARVNVTQEFENPSIDPVEAIYVFPLPQNSAVDYMEMRIEDRIIRGEIKKRDEARQIYEQARDSGYAAALLEQERPNIFTQNVANIPPGQKISVTLSYVEMLTFSEGVYEFVFPMVVEARYMPGTATGAQGIGEAPDTTQVPDASLISPPVAQPGVRVGHDIDLTVTVDAGLQLTDLKSILHEVKVEKLSETAARVTLANKDEIPNKDFILRYTAWGADLQMGAIPYSTGNGGYFSFVFMPPAAPPADYITPKEMIFVIDNSGSMGGYPVETAKQTMRKCVQQMNPNDTFNLIAFANTPEKCFAGPVANTPDNVTKALAFLDGQMGGGGTEMLPATLAALEPPEDPDRLRVICFMSDGEVGNDYEIVNAVKEKLGNARFFSFGIGNSVNRFLMEKLAQVGRGAVEFIELNTPGDLAADRFYRRISCPLLTDIGIKWSGLDVADVFPANLPDLFSQAPLIVTARYNAASTGEVVITGKLGGKPWEQHVPLTLPAGAVSNDPNEAIAKFWARQKIDYLMDLDWMGQQTRDGDPAIQMQIEDVALEFGIMSQYTSFVAVDSKIVNPTGTSRRVLVPLYMPEGVTGAGYGWPQLAQLGEMQQQLWSFEAEAQAAATELTDGLEEATSDKEGLAEGKLQAGAFYGGRKDAPADGKALRGLRRGEAVVKERIARNRFSILAKEPANAVWFDRSNAGLPRAATPTGTPGAGQPVQLGTTVGHTNGNSVTLGKKLAGLSPARVAAKPKTTTAANKVAPATPALQPSGGGAGYGGMGGAGAKTESLALYDYSVALGEMQDSIVSQIDPATQLLLSMLVRPLPVMADELLKLREAVGMVEPNLEALILSKMPASERVKYLTATRIGKDLADLKPDAVTIPGKMIVDNGRVEVVVRSVDLSVAAMAKMTAAGFAPSSIDPGIGAAIGTVAIEKLPNVAIIGGVTRIELPKYEK